MQKNTHSSTARWRWTGSTWWTWGRTGCRMRRWDIQDLHQTGASSRNLKSQRTSPVKWTTSVSCPDTLFRKLPPVPGTNSNYNTIDRIKKGEFSDFAPTQDGMPNYSPFYLAISKCSFLLLSPNWIIHLYTIRTDININHIWVFSVISVSFSTFSSMETYW